MFAGCHDPKVEVSNKYLSVYPNPARDYATVFVNAAGKPFTLRAFDNQGNEVAMTDLGNSTYSLPLRSSGTYYVLLEIDNITERQTIIAL